MRGQKGITLIALVITIIVMLILVAVTITMAINGGLFEKAGEAAQGTNGALTNEQSLANGTVDVNGRTENDINNLVDYYVNEASY
ncbi:MAG: hypothetical protein ACI4U9_03635 [Clostridia bacterium]